jgi:hypothetical protein
MIGRDYTPCEVTPVEFADILRKALLLCQNARPIKH